MYVFLFVQSYRWGRDIENTRMGSKVMPLANLHRYTESTLCMCSPFSHLSFDVSTTHVDTISRVKFTFTQTLLVGGAALKMRMKLGLTLSSRFAQQKFMVVIQCTFPQFADG